MEAASHAFSQMSQILGCGHKVGQSGFRTRPGLRGATIRFRVDGVACRADLAPSPDGMAKLIRGVAILQAEDFFGPDAQNGARDKLRSNVRRGQGGPSTLSATL